MEVAFKKAITLQKLLDENKTSDKESTYVVPLIWPCDDDNPVDDYHDDRLTAESSGGTFARMFGKFNDWCRKQEKVCGKQVSVLAHSMGNLVLQVALEHGVYTLSPTREMPQIFSNVFMVAADVVNEALERGESGQYIPKSAGNVVVYYAKDDLMMSASKIANLKAFSRRLGMTGPEYMARVPRNVYEVNCSKFNNAFDKLKGHTYFLEDDEGNASPIIKHMLDALETGSVNPPNRSHRL